MQMIEKYFPGLTETQLKQFSQLQDLYEEWNAQINVISRKDIEELNVRHVLHSLSIAKFINFKPQTTVLDIGTGGGFPGIPLAILFPEVDFHLVDSIGKKIKVVNEVAEALGLENVETSHIRAEELKFTYDFVVTRAVAPMQTIVDWCWKNISKQQKNAMPNGIIALKGGDLTEELQPFKKKVEKMTIPTYFEEEFFETKKIVYLPK